MAEKPRFKLRRMTAHDLDLVLAWRNHPRVRTFMLSQHLITPEEHRSWFSSVASDSTRVPLIAELNDEPTGCVIFSNVRPNGTADWSFYKAPNDQPGSGTRLCAEALEYAFDALGVHKVAAQVLEYNFASLRLHERLGFTQEGILREHCWMDGKHYSLICFGMLSSEWQTSQHM